MNKRASNLRASYSKKYHKEFLEHVDKNNESNTFVESTLYGDFIQTGNVDIEDIEKFSYSIFVTNKIIESLYQSIETIQDVFFISKIVEHGYFKQVKTFECLSLKNNLSISKEFGVFFTPLKIAREMAMQAVEESKSKVIIDPCCGTGNLLAACMEYADENGVKLEKLIGIELDAYSASVCKKTLEKYREKLNLDVEIEVINADSLDMLSMQRDFFGQEIESGTFIINPPYGKLKYDADTISNNETRLSYKSDHLAKKKNDSIQSQLKIKNVLNGAPVGKGILEWSKVFLSLCLQRVECEEALIFIGPCGWLNSVSQSDVRKLVVEENMFKRIHFLSETSTGFETVNQPLAIVSIKPVAKNSHIEILSDFGSSEKLAYDELKKLKSYNYPIPRISSENLKLFIDLQRFSKLSDETGVKNLRGELDQSINKSVMTTVKTSLKVIRGENIGRYSNEKVPDERTYFADEIMFRDQIGKKPKGGAHKCSRIVGRQCSYMKQSRRLIFDIVPPSCVVGNSCNYLTSEKESDLFFYLALLNSAVLDWYFRVFNGNNHVANYEIDDFPIPLVSEELKQDISNEVKRIKSNRVGEKEFKATTYYDDEFKLDAMVCEAYNLSKSEIKIVLADHDSRYTEKVINYMYEDKKNVA